MAANPERVPETAQLQKPPPPSPATASNPALAAALRALHLPTGKPDGPKEWEREVSTFPGRRVRPLPGQMTFDDKEVSR
jgi:hypothetical protein